MKTFQPLFIAALFFGQTHLAMAVDSEQKSTPTPSDYNAARIFLDKTERAVGAEIVKTMGVLYRLQRGLGLDMAIWNQYGEQVKSTGIGTAAVLTFGIGAFSVGNSVKETGNALLFLSDAAKKPIWEQNFRAVGAPLRRRGNQSMNFADDYYRYLNSKRILATKFFKEHKAMRALAKLWLEHLLPLAKKVLYDSQVWASNRSMDTYTPIFSKFFHDNGAEKIARKLTALNFSSAYSSVLYLIYTQARDFYDINLSLTDTQIKQVLNENQALEEEINQVVTNFADLFGLKSEQQEKLRGALKFDLIKHKIAEYRANIPHANSGAIELLKDYEGILNEDYDLTKEQAQKTLNAMKKARPANNTSVGVTEKVAPFSPLASLKRVLNPSQQATYAILESLYSNNSSLPEVAVDVAKMSTFELSEKSDKNILFLEAIILSLEGLPTVEGVDYTELIASLKELKVKTNRMSKQSKLIKKM